MAAEPAGRDAHRRGDRQRVLGDQRPSTFAGALHDRLARWHSADVVTLLNPRGETYLLDTPTVDGRVQVAYPHAVELLVEGLCGDSWTSRQIIVHIRNAGLVFHAMVGDIATGWEDAAQPRTGQTGLDTPELVPATADLTAVTSRLDRPHGAGCGRR